MTDRIIIDGKLISSKEEFFSIIRNQVGEDLLVGSNLDALHDVLTSLTVHTSIEISGEKYLSKRLGSYWKKVLWMISDCLDENRNLKLVMTEEPD